MDSAVAWFADLFGQCTKAPATGGDLEFGAEKKEQKKDTKTKKERIAKPRQDGAGQEQGTAILPGDAGSPACAGAVDAKRGRFLVDSSNLKIEVKGHPGVAYRYSKTDDDKVKAGPGPAKWGETVEGTDEGDGWLKVGRFYLPMMHQGVPVLTPAQEVLQEKQEPEPAQEPTAAERHDQEKQEIESVMSPGGNDLKELAKELLLESAQAVQEGHGPAECALTAKAMLQYEEDLESVQDVEDVGDAKELFEDRQLNEWVQSELLPNKQEF